MAQSYTTDELIAVVRDKGKELVLWTQQAAALNCKISEGGKELARASLELALRVEDERAIKIKELSKYNQLCLARAQLLEALLSELQDTQLSNNMEMEVEEVGAINEIMSGWMASTAEEEEDGWQERGFYLQVFDRWMGLDSGREAWFVKEIEDGYDSNEDRGVFETSDDVRHCERLIMYLKTDHQNYNGL
ncbi:hypothetical protein BCR33DRAFT_716143 [Rhizoclosmatium globosum]|uniref:Uncharacterized protein n=1 Tax=Rhizoclosmatium globosum TaxID=329046 RepID=A0A1Y2CIL3_9FUNG|nr:hypothetical protein BCR33DRAFT_716143 [Rhizoclosmatium globosum]|eukprot:ORY46155.1 hypothetical protein BCR33DRAFT_716143 [Rhizoclosmatium globosum]